ncbi:MAG: hypothetical protein J2P43_04760, partial [Candidatus Dormibacteraeota bacterium]|nr:hypothetical protein [Candidatus Dormibacteraeota bacterium]
MTAGLRSFFGILLAIVLVALGIYGLQNQEHVAVYFLFFTFHGTQAWIPAGVFSLLLFAICLVYGVLSGTVWLFRRRRLVRATSEHQSRAQSLSTQLEEARAEVARLREDATRREERRPVTDALQPGRSAEPGARAPGSPTPAQQPAARPQQPPAPAQGSSPPSQQPPAPAQESSP